MSIKVYIHFEETGFSKSTNKLVIPKSWVSSKTVADVIKLFTDAHNKKNPDHLITYDEVHLSTAEDDKLYSNVICGDILENHADYFVKRGVYIKEKAVDENENINKLRCKNYGCNMYFTEEENSDSACCHHIAPPVFHDTQKYWSCCKDRKAYDFETFQTFTGCSYGRHNTVNAGTLLSISPNAESSDAPIQQEPAKLKSISDYNVANPEAISATASAVKALTTRKSSRLEDGLTARCQRKGCQQIFEIARNNKQACKYHKGEGVFHDTYKFWSCCPDKKKIDFDDFLKVTGCCVGVHDDGVNDLDD